MPSPHCLDNDAAAFSPSYRAGSRSTTSSRLLIMATISEAEIGKCRDLTERRSREGEEQQAENPLGSESMALSIFIAAFATVSVKGGPCGGSDQDTPAPTCYAQDAIVLWVVRHPGQEQDTNSNSNSKAVPITPRILTPFARSTRDETSLWCEQSVAWQLKNSISALPPPPGSSLLASYPRPRRRETMKLSACTVLRPEQSSWMKTNGSSRSLFIRATAGSGWIVKWLNPISSDAAEASALFEHDDHGALRPLLDPGLPIHTSEIRRSAEPTCRFCNFPPWQYPTTRVARASLSVFPRVAHDYFASETDSVFDQDVCLSLFLSLSLVSLQPRHPADSSSESASTQCLQHRRREILTRLIHRVGGAQHIQDITDHTNEIHMTATRSEPLNGDGSVQGPRAEPTLYRLTLMLITDLSRFEMKKGDGDGGRA
ncbi:hypothetical protein IWX50DRAFT_614611 [Phyllosticta citricarpa]|uniref:Uncharacterized protein n=1 Tax=Phyllosticta citricarpa TaxID=55181 RepID=A0ABR1MPW8_9PEZI